MSQDNKKLVSQIDGLYNKFLLELQELEKKRQEVLDTQKNKTTYGDESGTIK